MAASALRRQTHDLLAAPRFRTAFDLSREPAALREQYGLHRSSQACLLGRRLLEAGVPFICVHWTTSEYPPLVANWDTHGGNFLHLKRGLLPVFDELFSALLEDLEQRGLLEDTLVLAVGEMGRTPRCTDPRTAGTNYGPGRDHWVGCQIARWSAAVSAVARCKARRIASRPARRTTRSGLAIWRRRCTTRWASAGS